MAAAGLGMIIFVSSSHVSLMGYFLVGVGCVNIVPIMFSTVGQQSAMSQAIAIPAVTTLGYMGVLAGPAVIGNVAHYSSLTVSFGLIMALMLFVGALSFTLNLGRNAANSENARE